MIISTQKTKNRNALPGKDCLSKSDVLKWLKPRLRHSRIEEIIMFTVKDWLFKSDEIAGRICSGFSPGRIVVRSSSLVEDGLRRSNAGRFYSALNVTAVNSDVVSAVNRVISSYDDARFMRGENQILVQPQTKDIKTSGVVLTRQIETNAPYYVINFDESSGRTDTVTGGLEGKTIYISRFNCSMLEKRWDALIRAVKEIEEFFPGRVLDIEFGITGDDSVVIFQVRPLAANTAVPIPDDTVVENLLKDMVDKFRRYSGCEAHIAGTTTIFGDMPDWNPSEIIGPRPNTLDYTVYSFIVTDDIWHEARTSMGYYDVYPAELMVSFAKKPYIDMRTSFNSFTPACISNALREKLVKYYLDQMRDNPAYQDKVEFEILWTCYDFSTRKELKRLPKRLFTKDETNELLTALRSMTNDILRDYRKITEEDMKRVRLLTERRVETMRRYKRQKRSPWYALSTAFNILQNCKKFGTFPFSRQARLAFIAKSLLISLKEQGVISEVIYHGFLNSIRTVASRLNDDFYLLQSGKLRRKDFIERYGHLRAGTYDITAPRYDGLPHLFNRKAADSMVSRRAECRFSMPREALKAVDDEIRAHRLYGNAGYLIDFIRSAVENREYAKFEFTKSLSDALELIAEAGTMLGFKRERLCHADLLTIMKFRNPEKADLAYARRIIGQSIERHKKERCWYDAIVLPPVITSENDFYYIKPYVAMPNFITGKSIKGRLVIFDEIRDAENPVLKGRILLLENADPGYDWIFTKAPLAIITKYGGVASHMSIRCAEFGIPAAIGCGEAIYDQLKKTKMVLLDCGKKLIRPLDPAAG